MLWADYSAGRPGGAALAAAGFGGVLRYGGTPGRAKNITAGEYNDLAAAGLLVALVYEDIAGDAEGGYNAGQAHAQALLADATACGVPPTTALCVAADEHLTAAQITVAVQYQAGFYRTVKAVGWPGPVGAYGFGEFITAVQSAGVADWLWQCGAQPASDSGVHVWQRNGSDGQPTTTVVAGIECDINQQLMALPGDDVTTFSDQDKAVMLDGAASCRQGQAGDHPAGALYLLAAQQADKLDVLTQQITALQGVVTQDDAALLDALKSVPAGAVDPVELAKALEANGLPAAVVSALIAFLSKAQAGAQ